MVVIYLVPLIVRNILHEKEHVEMVSEKTKISAKEISLQFFNPHKI